MPQYMVPPPQEPEGIFGSPATVQNLTAEKLDQAIKSIEARIRQDMAVQGLSGALGRLDKQFPMTSPDPGHTHAINDPGHSHSIGMGPAQPFAPKPGRLTEKEYWELLRLRMRWRSEQQMGVKHMSLFVDDDKAYVFVVGQTGPVVLEDEVSLFPSDTLVGQLILIEEGNRKR